MRPGYIDRKLIYHKNQSFPVGKYTIPMTPEASFLFLKLYCKMTCIELWLQTRYRHFATLSHFETWKPRGVSQNGRAFFRSSGYNILGC